MKHTVAVCTLLILAGITRLSLMNWDSGYHLHPDERMIIMVADKVHFFDNLNPNFFNYGSLPIYLLKATADWHDALGLTPSLSNYDGMLGVGRVLATVFDLITIIMIYKLGRLVFRNKNVALSCALVYSIAFFPIQNSHFFVVDVLLTSIATFILYLLIRYIQSPSLSKSAGIGVAAAGAITTKFTGVLLLPVIVLAIIVPFLPWMQKRRKKRRTPKIPRLFASLVVFSIVALLTSFIFMPYAFILPIQYILYCQSTLSCSFSLLNTPVVKDILLQMRMNSDPFIFPYTLQYVGTLPYLYYFKNIVIWGWGPALSILAFVGFARALAVSRNLKHTDVRLQSFALIAIFYLFFALVIGRSAVKFMRYMLPAYPAMALLAGYGLSHLIGMQTRVKQSRQAIFSRAFGVFLILTALIWTLMFLSIYRQKHTRIAASEWVYKNIPQGATIATEHWDDRLPLRIRFADEKADYIAEMYPHKELGMYEPDTPQKWNLINAQLLETDYLIIASNRLYGPLTRLTDCKRLPENRCYRESAQFYQELFAGKRGFVKVAEFTSFPRLEIGKFKLVIDDTSSDESFTVYDHPKVMVFKNINSVH